MSRLRGGRRRPQDDVHLQTLIAADHIQRHTVARLEAVEHVRELFDQLDFAARRGDDQILGLQAGPVGRVVSGVDPNVFGVNTFFALVVAEFYEAAPYYIISAAAALSTVDPRLEQDAQLLGHRQLTAFRKVTLPLAAPGLAAGLAIAWARAMGAFGAVLIVAYNPAGLPIRIDTSFIENGLSGALPFALLLIVAALPLPLIGLMWSARARGTRREFAAAAALAEPVG